MCIFSWISNQSPAPSWILRAPKLATTISLISRPWCRGLELSSSVITHLFRLIHGCEPFSTCCTYISHRIKIRLFFPQTVAHNLPLIGYWLIGPTIRMSAGEKNESANWMKKMVPVNLFCIPALPNHIKFKAWWLSALVPEWMMPD